MPSLHAYNNAGPRGTRLDPSEDRRRDWIDERADQYIERPTALASFENALNAEDLLPGGDFIATVLEAADAWERINTGAQIHGDFDKTAALFKALKPMRDVLKDAAQEQAIADFDAECREALEEAAMSRMEDAA